MTILEEAKQHLATYGAAHTECCGTPLIRKLVAEVERLGGEAKCEGCRQGLALCTDYNGTSIAPRKYHMASNGQAVPHVE